jgi:hypothetical protein
MVRLDRLMPPVLCAVAFLVALAGPDQMLGMSGDELALDYLVQDVCVDVSGRVLPVDPYYCPAGGALRPLEPGEPLPYHRFDQPHLQGRDSFPVRTHDGQEIVINTFDHAPFGHFKPDRDGYSITMVRDGWASSGGTRSRMLGTTFFGTGCRPYGGWVYFPVGALDGRLIRPGEARAPIRAVHWERNGEPWPGHCPSSYETGFSTSWEPLPRFSFAGIAGTPVKTIDAIRSIHGFAEGPRFLAHGHLEIFYFTRLYGFTRWESWVPDTGYPRQPLLDRRIFVASERCRGPAESAYKGITFARADCRDWTSVVVPPRPEPPPFWPVPYLN